MEENTPIGFVKPGTISDPLTKFLRTGARKLIEAALQAELAEFLQFQALHRFPASLHPLRKVSARRWLYLANAISGILLIC